MSTRSVLVTIIKRRCPRCIQGELFQGWLKQNHQCAVCQLQFFDPAASGDGPAVLLVFVLGALFVPIAWTLTSVVSLLLAFVLASGMMLLSLFLLLPFARAIFIVANARYDTTST